MSNDFLGHLTLTPMDFYHQGFLKAQVYTTEPICVVDLCRRIFDALNIITPAMLGNAQRDFISRIQYCFVADCGLFE